ncbi:alpha-1,4-glucan:maltose-1-phosphate maltosyltransferase [Granulicella pectinivorans]|uniref:Alpha-1,4-glucan:maltose-1-phosphate maltosyltransferase n=1 Tax=Granulicella pectinivorans TaxID=474950 RepID=A0A1I6MZB2_9BACT|nr:alpha-1,4-glucan--maltose-1-phosphate maltosyltransferase [Granulicella pectinivorans]SFS21033.1 alpha-1,4-glucan:maltose-1-phosphate maltosyltransferase [Granulicella pectinivorans]
MKPVEGRKRVVVEQLSPQVDSGRYPACRILGDTVTVTAAVFGDGHDHVAARLMYRHESERRWRFVTMVDRGNDVWSGDFLVDQLGSWQFTVQGWIDHFDTWSSDLQKRLAAQPDPHSIETVGTVQDIPLALRTGALLLEEIAARAKGPDHRQLTEIVASLRWMADQGAVFYENPITPEILELAARYPDTSLATKFERDLPLWVDRERARYSTWYELFPRSASPDPTRTGRFEDVEKLLPEIAAMGFDVVYMPPVHPIGTAYRKGPNNNVVAQDGDLGSPWAIGAAKAPGVEGGHKSIHPELGTLKTFDHLVKETRKHGMEIAMDIAFQASPDHPWVTEHPTWFKHRPDGTIQYAENPPKKYQDIYPLDFESVDWRGLWQELYAVFKFWVDRDVKIFRVDNPHTKALPFWEWCIAEVHKDHPDVLFLAEAFTRPHVMYSLAKGGFTQSYTYFTWRTTKPEIQAYFEEITKPPVTDFFQPNLWPNTPDILHEFLQKGGRPAFMQRLILAATLGANYGIYGPAYELGENKPAKPVSEEYLDSEKYEAKHWDRTAPHSIAPLITRVNQIRRENKALQSNNSLHFHNADNPNILCYSKVSGDNIILVAINLDYSQQQSGWIDLDLRELNIPHNQNFDVEDLLTGTHYTWHDRSNYVALRPEVLPAHVFRVTRLG